MIAIIGASGQLGRRTVEALLASEHPPDQVIAAVRTPEKVKSWQDQGIQVRRADYDEPESLASALDGVQRVLLVPSVALPVERVRQYDNAITAARNAGVEHIVHYGLVPTTVASQFLVTPFLLFAESAIRTSGLSWTILRNSLYADPIADWVPSIVKLGTIPYPTGNGRCAFISREDIARAGAAVLTKDGHEGCTYNLTGPQALKTKDLCDIVSRVTGKPVEYKDATEKDYIDVCREEGEPEFMTQFLLTLYRDINNGLLDVVTDDIERLSGQPAESFESFLSRHLNI